jgi:hypothetical protein
VNKIDLNTMTAEQVMKVLWESATPGGPGKVKVVSVKKPQPKKGRKTK